MAQEVPIGGCWQFAMNIAAKMSKQACLGLDVKRGSQNETT